MFLFFSAPVPMSEIERMAALCMKDLDDEDIGDDDLDDEDLLVKQTRSPSILDIKLKIFNHYSSVKNWKYLTFAFNSWGVIKDLSYSWLALSSQL